MINSVVLMGRLTRDPELRSTGTGIDVCTFSIAVDRNFVSRGQERQADFINCVAWRNTATFINRYFQKGQMIAVTGSIQTRSYESKTGEKRTAFEVVIDRASFCGSKAESGNAGAPAQSAPVRDNNASAFSNSNGDDFEMISDESDLPF